MALPQDQMSKLMELAGKADDTSEESPPASTTPPPLSRKQADASSDFETPPRRVARRRPAGPVRSKIAANDDVPSIGGLIYALEQKPSTKVFRVAGFNVDQPPCYGVIRSVGANDQPIELCIPVHEFDSGAGEGARCGLNDFLLVGVEE